MDQHRLRKMEGATKGTVEVPAHTGKRQEDIHSTKSSLSRETHSFATGLRVVKILALFAVPLLFFGCGNEVSKERLASIEARLDRMDAQIARLEGEMKKMAWLENQVGDLERSIDKVERSLAAGIGAPMSEERTSQVKTGYHVVRPGEILSRIARRYDMSLNELCRLNQITPKTIIRPGQKLLVTLSSE